MQAFFTELSVFLALYYNLFGQKTQYFQGFYAKNLLLSSHYLATMDITKKWTGHRQDWGQIHSQLEIYFEERLIGRNL